MNSRVAGMTGRVAQTWNMALLDLRQTRLSFTFGYVVKLRMHVCRKNSFVCVCVCVAVYIYECVWCVTICLCVCVSAGVRL